MENISSDFWLENIEYLKAMSKSVLKIMLLCLESDIVVPWKWYCTLSSTLNSNFLWRIFLQIFGSKTLSILKQWVKVSWKWYLMNGNRMTRKKQHANWIFYLHLLFILVILLLISLCFSSFLKFTSNHVSI